MKILRYSTLIGGLMMLVLAIGFVFQNPIAIKLWPWPDGRYSYLFIGSILVAASVAMIWVGWTGDLGVLPAGSLNILVIAALTSIYFFQLAFQEDRPALIPFGFASFLTAIASGASFLMSRGLPFSEPRPTPWLVRVSFAIFIVSLLFAGTALISGIQVFPWALNPNSSTIFGCIFIGDAFYFLYGLFRPRWENARGQLLSFLAYDLVLILPFLTLFNTVKPEHLVSLVVYVAILIYSGLLAVYFLFLNTETRFAFRT